MWSSERGIGKKGEEEELDYGERKVLGGGGEEMVGKWRLIERVWKRRGFRNDVEERDENW